MHIGPRHKTVRVRCNGMDARIDEMLAPLIKRLWQFKILTYNCCQENRPGIAWIEFATSNDAAMFLNIVASHYFPSKRDLKTYKFWDTIYGRMTRPSFGEWEYTPLVMEIGGKRVVSFINRDYPLPLKEIPPEIKFAQSPISSNFDITPEEIQGREEELAAYLLEYLQEDPNLRTTRGDKTLCVSRLGTNGKRHYFLLNITLDAIESTVEDEV